MASPGPTVILKLSSGEVVSGQLSTHNKECISLLHVQDFVTQKPLVARARFFFYEITKVGLPAANGNVNEVLLHGEDRDDDYDPIERMYEFFHALALANAKDSDDTSSSEAEEPAENDQCSTNQCATEQCATVSHTNDDTDFLLVARETRMLKKTPDATEEVAKGADKGDPVAVATASKPVTYCLCGQLKEAHNCGESSSTSSVEKISTSKAEVEEGATASIAKDKDERAYEQFMQLIDFDRNLEDPRSAEFEYLKENVRKHYYVRETKSEFRSCFNRLAQRETIAVHGIDCDNGRKSALPVLVLAHYSQIYILDLYLLRGRQQWNEVRLILENPDITKVVYDSRSLTDCLYHNHKVQLRNVFDLTIADSMVEKERNGVGLKKVRPLHECVELYLNMPTSLFRKAQESCANANWSRRPLSMKQRIDAAILAAPLIMLGNKLKKKLLSDFYREVYEHKESLKRLDVAEWPKDLKQFSASS